MQPTVAALFARHKRRKESAPAAAELSTAPGDRLPDTPSSAACEARLCDGAEPLSSAEASRSEQAQPRSSGRAAFNYFLVRTPLDSSATTRARAA
jgi:hypothetical protein